MQLKLLSNVKESNLSQKQAINFKCILRLKEVDNYNADIHRMILILPFVILPFFLCLYVVTGNNVYCLQ